MDLVVSTSAVVPASVAVPLAGAALLAGFGRLLPRWASDLIAIAVALATATLTLVLVAASAGRPMIYWFSGWRPSPGTVIGVDYAVGPLGAGMASLAGVLASAALVYSWRYFDSARGRHHALVLIFLAASVDFCLTGDLFNLFVAFELVAVAAFALTGYNAGHPAPLQGAINFAVTNSLGGMSVLMGVGFLYARTGSLNLAQIGQALTGRHADGLIVVAFALLTGGFLVKAAVVPFHFWLPDAYGSAPIPVCVLFAGVMSELGLFAVIRVWDTVFSGLAGGSGPRMRAVLLGFGILTAVVGAVMALAQIHLKRMLAFVTMSHLGIYLIGVGLLTPLGLAGAALLVIGDGLAKSALFLGVGVVQHQRASVSEIKLRGARPRPGCHRRHDRAGRAGPGRPAPLCVFGRARAAGRRGGAGWPAVDRNRDRALRHLVQRSRAAGRRTDLAGLGGSRGLATGHRDRGRPRGGGRGPIRYCRRRRQAWGEWAGWGGWGPGRAGAVRATEARAADHGAAAAGAARDRVRARADVRHRGTCRGGRGGLLGPGSLCGGGARYPRRGLFPLVAGSSSRPRRRRPRAVCSLTWARCWPRSAWRASPWTGGPQGSAGRWPPAPAGCAACTAA